MMSRKLERVNIVTSSLLKVHLQYEKYLKENLKPLFSRLLEALGQKGRIFGSSSRSMVI